MNLLDRITNNKLDNAKKVEYGKKKCDILLDISSGKINSYAKLKARAKVFSEDVDVVVLLIENYSYKAKSFDASVLPQDLLDNKEVASALIRNDSENQKHISPDLINSIQHNANL